MAWTAFSTGIFASFASHLEWALRGQDEDPRGPLVIAVKAAMLAVGLVALGLAYRRSAAARP